MTQYETLVSKARITEYPLRVRMAEQKYFAVFEQ
jgi:hypothetical protein